MERNDPRERSSVSPVVFGSSFDSPEFTPDGAPWYTGYTPVQLYAVELGQRSPAA
jgi:hypothetical protein